MYQTEPGFTIIDPATHRKLACSSTKSSPSLMLSSGKPTSLNKSSLNRTVQGNSNAMVDPNTTVVRTAIIPHKVVNSNTILPPNTVALSNPIKYHPTAPLPITSTNIITTSSPNENIVTPQTLLSSLLASETHQNNYLIEILSFIKPNIKDISVIIRGLFTKNSKLLGLLNNCLKQTIEEKFNDKEILKDFVNEFILWLKNDTIKLLEKFNNILRNIDSIDPDIIGDKFNTFINPILNCQNYVKFLVSCTNYLRNPFIIDEISNLKRSIEIIIENFYQELKFKRLNTIKFNNIKSFDGQQLVSSCFKLNQIVDRTEMEVFFINNNTNQLVELCLLDLSDPSEQRSNHHRSYNALAILAIEEDFRSLIYPPFRINEFSVNFFNSSIVLTPIDYTFNKLSRELIINSTPSNLGVLKLWYDKLTNIFPYSLKNNPINSDFHSQKKAEMNGLGIMVSNTSCNSLPSTLTERSHGHTLNSPPRPKYSHNASQPDLTQKYDSQSTGLPTLRRKSSVSLNSNISSDCPTKSMQIVNKVISTTSQCSLNEINELIPELKQEGTPRHSYSACLIQDSQSSSHTENNYSDSEFSPESIISSYSDENICDLKKKKVENKNDEHTLSKPSTTMKQASLIEGKKQNLAHKTPSISGNIHDLEKSRSISNLAPPSTLYKLSTGSSIDITKFGSSHRPTFSVMNLAELANGSTTSVDSASSKKSKRKFLGLFRKSSSKSNSPAIADHASQTPLQTKNSKNLRINTKLEAPEADGLQAATFGSGSSSYEKQKSYSQLPSPFALPSSTSTYFFKQNSQNSSVSTINQDAVESGLEIPKDLKDKINDAEDVYISQTSPKAMQISKWKQKYGKWEMITVNENLFIKIVVDHETRKGWIIAFEEVGEFDEPILILDLNDCGVRQSTSLDVQLSGINSITAEKLIITLRCKNGLLDEITTNLDLAIKSISGNDKSLKSSSSNATIMSPMNSVMQSKSSTLSSISTYGDSLSHSNLVSSQSSNSANENLNSKETNNNTGNKESVTLVEDMMVRLQRLNNTYDQINNPDAWQVLSMYSLSIQLVKNQDRNYLNLILNNMQSNSQEDFIWSIEEDDKHNIFERIGKAGLLLKAENGEYYMIECKGKKEFTILQRIL